VRVSLIVHDFLDIGTSPYEEGIPDDRSVKPQREVRVSSIRVTPPPHPV
jgi:hypothetical protein